ncbi:hypothetical protein E4U60_007368 [Claviceps pazoutovae]|uniref:Uncharacterized protein n=1 Tax=Claviceps pazoutovae TaxID=1649127 RepID=A0A9P7SI30_9HYPO|nr:hypothetical protein E4U60_007368 [Claviceps pazoutovae]
MKASSIWGAANVVLSTSSVSHSLVTTQPRATGIAPLPEHGASLPKPTPPPRPDDLHQDLVKKKAAPEKPLTMMVGHDNICGWLSAREDTPYACKAGDTCGLILAQTTSSGALMCFNEERQTYDLVHACIDYNNYYSFAACDSSCVRNTFTSKCTKSSLPYCMTYAIFGDITDYRCHSISDTAQTVLASYIFDHETGYKVFSKSVKFVLPFFVDMHFTTIPNSTVTGAEFSSSGGANSSSGGANSSSGGANGSSGGENSVKDSSKTPVGAIVGGVVGGVAAIGAGLLIIFFCLRRRKNQAAGTTETPPSSHQAPLQPTASPGIFVTQNQDPAFYGSHSNLQSKPLQVSAEQCPPTASPPQGDDFAQQRQASELQAVPAQQLQQQQPPHEHQTKAYQLQPQRSVHEVAV